MFLIVSLALFAFFSSHRTCMILPSRVGIRVCVVGVLVVTRLLFNDGIQLIGLPAPHAAFHRRLFALTPCRTAVSPLPSSFLQQLSMHHRHVLGWTFRFCSVAKALALHP